MMPMTMVLISGCVRGAGSGIAVAGRGLIFGFEGVMCELQV